MKLTILGTGHGTATECYNTCFTIDNQKEYFLVDAGGGNGILKQLKDANINIEQIKKIFISHTHSDHILGVIWIIRVLTRKYLKEGYNKEHYIYGNDEVIKAIRSICKVLLPNKFLNFIDRQIKLISVGDGETIEILDRKCIFFDTKSSDVKQYGFYLKINKKDRFTFIGDEVCSENTKKYVKNTKWLFADAYKPELNPNEFGKNYRHSTVRFVAELSQELNAENIILSHCLDDDLKNRKKTFTEVAQKYFYGNIFVPDDLEEIELN